VSRRGKLVVISGPSGVGKSTIVREALRRCDAQFSVSVTTRPSRAGEVDGGHYRFVDDATFQKMVDGGELLEWAEVYGQRYGTPAAFVHEAVTAGKTVILEIDVAGAKQVHQREPDAVFVLIEPPDGETLRARLAGRGTETDDELQRRIDEAAQEIADASASGVYNHRVVNDSLDTAIDDVVEIIQQETTQE